MQDQTRQPSEASLAEAPVANGKSLRSVLGATAIFLFAIQAVTGLLLMTAYSPSTTTAWSSVWYIQTQVPAGWLIRGLHHFASDAFLVVLALHGLQMLVTRSYVAPGHRAWVLTICLVGLALSLSLTGHFLPWDQAGYWGTMVRVNILAKTPVIGDMLRNLVVGGSELGNLTLTRFYTLHVMILPAAVVAAIVYRRRAVRNSPANCQPIASHSEANLSGSACCGVSVRTALTCATSLGVLMGVAWLVCGRGGDALLDAPADPTTADYPARPEWHTLFLFQWLKYADAPGIGGVLGAIIAPGLLVGCFLMFPFASRWIQSSRAHKLALGFSLATVLSAGFLTYDAIRDDREPSEAVIREARARQADGESLNAAEEHVLAAHAFNIKYARAKNVAHRAMELASLHGIPPDGPLSLLANDPVTRGPMLFAANCASCHRHDGHDGLGSVPSEPATSSDLAGFATQEWIRALLSDPTANRFFGRMTKPDGDPAHTRMARWTQDILEEYEDDESRRMLLAQFDDIATYLEDESKNPGRLSGNINSLGDMEGALATVAKASASQMVRRGRKQFMARCNECHSYMGERSGTIKAPEMFGYGSVAWIERMIADPSHDTLYRSRGRERAQMPAFGDRLSERDRNLLARWLHATPHISKAGAS